ncbi:MAG: histidine--tRNA ligase [Erysipelotrichaceae bacterium]|nr:histidine--tRNA ligase [Erysipelotrichaceae bacterium]
MYQTVKGTYDILPDDLKAYEDLEDSFRLLLELYGYKLMKTPVFEYTGVFKKENDTSDMVTKEMYTFSPNEKDSLTLRPEGTAGIIRSVIQNKLYASNELPLKLAYIEEMFRHERPQKGRQRQFTQMGVECLGDKSPLIDAEVIALGYNFIKLVGLKDIKVLINSLGDSESRLAYKDALKNYFKDYKDQLCYDCQNRFDKNPLRILDCKVDHDKDFMKNAPKMSDYLSESAKQYFDKLKMYLDELNIPYVIDDKLVRGLDYYTDTVFEVVSTNNEAGSQATIFAGGRYDNLVEELGGPSLSGIGFAIGLERLLIMARAEDVMCEIEDGVDCYLIDVSGGSPYALKIAEELRNNFYSCVANLYERSMKSQFKSADRIKATYTLIVGEDELNNNTVTIKDNITKEQINVPYIELIKTLEDMEKKHE